MIRKFMFLFLGARYFFPVFGIGNNVTEVQILKARLFENYDREIKPTANTDQPILVLLSFSLLSVFELDMKQQALSTLIVFKISWKDELLKWNKTQYNGLDKLTVNLQSVWKPDIIILNSIDKQKTLINYGDDTNYVTINSDGMIKWNVYVNLETRCKVITKYYPFETQTCDINLTKSYLDDQSEILISDNSSINTDLSVSNSEWEVYPVESFQRSFPHPEGELIGLQLQIRMKRRCEFYVWNYIMPSISLSFADSFVFVLPVKSADKITLSIFVFLANAVLIRLFNDSIPPISETSLFGVLLWVSLLLSGIVILLNIIITAFYYRQSLKHIKPCCGDITDFFKCKSLCSCKHNHEDAKRIFDSSFTLYDQTNNQFMTFPVEETNLQSEFGSTAPTTPKKTGPDITWSDVSRNIDIICTISLFIIYVIVYASLLGALNNELKLYTSKHCSEKLQNCGH